MTEKRFERIYADVDVFCRDRNAKGVNQLIGREDYDRIVDLLNEQHEQIERLKQNFRALEEVKCELAEENEQLKTENTMLKEHQNINCQNCQYFVSDSVSSDCLKREDIGYKGTCIDGMDLHMLAKNCPYY